MDRKEYQKEYRDLNKEEIKDYKKKWYRENKERLLEKAKIYYEKNKNNIKERNRLYIMEKNNSDMNYRIKRNVRASIYSGISMNFFNAKLEKTLGYMVSALKEKIEKDFLEGMSWKNFGSKFIKNQYWHIHHIIPMKIYNFYDEKDIKKCWDLDNLLPLWNKDKNDFINWNLIESLDMERLLPDTMLEDDLIGRHHEV